MAFVESFLAGYSGLSRAGKMEPFCPLRTTRSIPQEKFPRKPCNKSFIDQVCSVKMAGYCRPRKFPVMENVLIQGEKMLVKVGLAMGRHLHFFFPKKSQNLLSVYGPRLRFGP